MGSISTFDQVTTFLGSHARECVSDISWGTGYASGTLKNRALGLWDKVRQIRQPREKRSFKDELAEVLLAKQQAMGDITFPLATLDAITRELFKILACSLASERTPNEIIDGLRDDAEMRGELKNLVVSATGLGYYQEQLIFLDRILSGDPELRELLNKQKTKKRFSYLM